MNSHDNDDYMRRLQEAYGQVSVSPEDRIAALREKAERMVGNGSSSITAGKPGEQVLLETTAHGVLLRRLPDDEHGVNRISIGGDRSIGVYCVLRGNPADCEEILRKALKAIRAARGLS